MLKILAGSAIVLSVLALPSQAAIIEIEEDKARTAPVNMAVANGQTSSIVFNNGEIIDNVVLSDLSQSVYNLNAPVDSGNATNIYLRKINRLEIPGATTSNTPNLLVETKNENGERNQYEFLIDVTGAIERDRVTINPAPVPPPPAPEPEPEPVTTITTRYGEATPDDVRLGIEVAIKNNEIPADGAIVIAAQEYVAITRNGTAAQDALIQTKLPLSVVSKLGTLGQEEDAKRRIMPLPKDFLGK